MRILNQIIILLLFVSCATNFISEDEVKEDKIKFKDRNSSILKSKEVLKDSSFIVNRYPISGEVEIPQEQTKTPRPKELFSASSENEIRLHKLGEVRWIYLGLEPSSVWPMAIEFLKSNEIYKLGAYDPSTGIINSKNFRFNNQETKIEFKLERGLQQSSTEIFVTHLTNLNGNWEIIPNENSDLNKNLFVFEITSKKKIVLVSIKKNVNLSDMESLGAEFYGRINYKTNAEYYLNLDSTTLKNESFIGHFLHGLKLKSYGIL